MDNMAIDPTALALLERTPAVLRLLLDDLPPETLRHRNPEGWSITDVVAHLHDAESVAFTGRIRRMLDEDTPFIESIDPPARLQLGDYARRTLPDLLNDLAAQRAVDVAWVRQLSGPDLARPGRHDQAGIITSRALVHQWAYHDLAHLRQIMEMLQAALVPRMDNTTSFYPEAQALAAWPRP